MVSVTVGPLQVSPVPYNTITAGPVTGEGETEAEAIRVGVARLNALYEATYTAFLEEMVAASHMSDHMKKGRPVTIKRKPDGTFEGVVLA